MSSALFDWTEPSLTASLQGIEGVQGASCTSWMRFKYIEPHRTFSNCILTDIARYIDFFHTSSVWFDCTTPSPTTSLQGLQGVQGAICTSSGRFKHIEPHRTFSSYILTEIARYLAFFYTSSGWFDWTEPSPTTSLQGIQGVQGAICTGSGRFKHIEPHRTFSNYILRASKVNRVLVHEFGVVRLYRTFSDYSFTGDRRSAGCTRYSFNEVQAHRTSSNLLDLHPHRESKVYRHLSHEFGVVRLD